LAQICKPGPARIISTLSIDGTKSHAPTLKRRNLSGAERNSRVSCEEGVRLECG
jgi:hypothetical protein